MKINASRQAANDPDFGLELRAARLSLLQSHNVGYPAKIDIHYTEHRASTPSVGGKILKFPIRHHRESDPK
jgi:hypothetical protein